MDYYTILGVARNATQREIKMAYRKMAQKYHPDVSDTTNDDFIKLINSAYDTLSNPIKKQQYDATIALQSSTRTTSYPRNTYNNPRRPPTYYYRKPSATPEYDFSIKRQIIGWVGAFTLITVAVVAVKLMEVYGSVYYFNKGQEAEDKYNYYQALNFYDEAIRDWGINNVEALLRSTIVYQKLGAFNRMADEAQSAFEFNATDSQKGQLYFLLGVAYFNLNEPKLSESMFLDALKFKYTSDSVYAYQAPLNLYQLNNYQEAEIIYSKLIKNNPKNLTYLFERGIALQEQGKHVLAIRDFKNLLNKNPKNKGKVFFQVGRSYIALGNKTLGCKYLQAAVDKGVAIDLEELEQVCN